MTRAEVMKLDVLMQEFKRNYGALLEFCEDNVDLLEKFRQLLAKTESSREDVKVFLKENGEPGKKYGEFSVTKSSEKEEFDLAKLPREVLTYPGVVSRVNTKAVSDLMKLPGYADLAGKVAEARMTIASTPSVGSPKLVSADDLDKMLTYMLGA